MFSSESLQVNHLLSQSPSKTIFFPHGYSIPDDDILTYLNYDGVKLSSRSIAK